MAKINRDIKSRNDINRIIRRFYGYVNEDRLLKLYFKNYDKQWWEVHYETMTSFWCNVIFNEADYSGNPAAKHIKLSRAKKLTPKAFERWLFLFQQAVFDEFTGPNANFAVQKSKDIAIVIDSIVNKK